MFCKNLELKKVELVPLCFEDSGLLTLTKYYLGLLNCPQGYHTHIVSHTHSLCVFSATLLKCASYTPTDDTVMHVCMAVCINIGEQRLSEWLLLANSHEGHTHVVWLRGKTISAIRAQRLSTAKDQKKTPLVNETRLSLTTVTEIKCSTESFYYFIHTVLNLRKCLRVKNNPLSYFPMHTYHVKLLSLCFLYFSF